MSRADDYDMASRERIARHIKARYDQLGETHKDFALRLGVARESVTNILNGKAKGIGLDTFIKAWKNLQLDPYQMLTKEPQEVSRPMGLSALGRLSEAPRGPALQVATLVEGLEPAEAVEAARKFAGDVAKIKRARAAKSRRSGG